MSEFPRDLPPIPPWMDRETRPVPEDVKSAIKYIDSAFAAAVEKNGADAMTVTVESDHIRVATGDEELWVYEPTKKLFSMRIRRWKNGVEGVPSSFTSRAETHARAAYDALFDAAMA